MRAGDHITFSYKGKQLDGLVVNAGERVTVKLSSGYNIIAKPGELKGVKQRTVASKPAGKATPRKPKKELPPITILHTGGTIASKVDYETGAVIAQFDEQELLRLFPEVNEVACIKSRLVSNIQSEMMRFGHWNVLIDAIKEEVTKGARGIVVTHGTDTLHMTAAALALALEHLPVPVILVGSQRSSDRPSSDAASNLLCAVRFATEAFPGVAICMHDSIERDDCAILPAERSRKMHTTRRDAFKPINDEPFALVRYPGLVVEQRRPYPKAPAGTFGVSHYNAKLRIGIQQVHPHMDAKELLAYEQFDGLVLSLLGIGHAPTMATDEHNKENEKVLAAITKLAKKMPVVGAPQTIYGRVNMNVYTPGRQLLEAGLLGQGCDVTPETAFVRLAWMLSGKGRSYPTSSVRSPVPSASPSAAESGLEGPGRAP